MSEIHSTVTDLPVNCHRAADRMSQALSREDQFADLTENSRRKLSGLEQELSQETGENVVLVAYRV